MEKLTAESKAIMEERFGVDQVISLATIRDNVPAVRYVNALYRDGSFYILTYALSRKMEELALNPHAAIAGDWFTAKGLGEDMGSFAAEDNTEIAEWMRQGFAAWIDNGHMDLADPNSHILRIRLTQGVLFSHGRRFDIDFEQS